MFPKVCPHKYILCDWRPGLGSSGNTYKHKLSAWVYDAPKSSSTVLLLITTGINYCHVFTSLSTDPSSFQTRASQTFLQEKCLHFLPDMLHSPSPLGVMPLLSAGLTTQQQYFRVCINCSTVPTLRMVLQIVAVPMNSADRQVYKDSCT